VWRASRFCQHGFSRAILGEILQLGMTNGEILQLGMTNPGRYKATVYQSQGQLK
jgi:hypothetical protein